jgi:hypothetical protein
VAGASAARDARMWTEPTTVLPAGRRTSTGRGPSVWSWREWIASNEHCEGSLKRGYVVLQVPVNDQEVRG